MERIDLLIQAHVNRARRLQKTDEFQGLYIPDEQVDELLARPAGLPRWANEARTPAEVEAHASAGQLAQFIASRAEQSRKAGIVLPLHELQSRFKLSRFEMDAILICLALEVDVRYERLYGYLQDDVTRRRPGIDLILNLLSPDLDRKIALRASFLPGAPLLHHQLVVLTEDQPHARSPLCFRNAQLDERIANYLLGHDSLDVRLTDAVEVVNPAISFPDVVLRSGVTERLASLVQTARTAAGITVYLQGPSGIGKRSVAEAFSRELGLTLLAVNLEAMGLTPAEFRGTVRLIFRELCSAGHRFISEASIRFSKTSTARRLPSSCTKCAVMAAWWCWAARAFGSPVRCRSDTGLPASNSNP